MYRRKVYGASKIEGCPFCDKQSTTQSGQGIAVCQDHTKSELLNLKCVCNDWLDLRIGKFGAYFNCMSCGNMQMKKALEINQGRDIMFHSDKDKIESMIREKRKKAQPRQVKVKSPMVKETIIRSDELDFM